MDKKSSSTACQGGYLSQWPDAGVRRKREDRRAVLLPLTGFELCVRWLAYMIQFTP